MTGHDEQHEKGANPYVLALSLEQSKSTNKWDFETQELIDFATFTHWQVQSSEKSFG